MRHGLSWSGVALALAAWAVSCSASDDGVQAPSGDLSGGSAGVGGGFSTGTGGSSSGIASGGAGGVSASSGGTSGTLGTSDRPGTSGTGGTSSPTADAGGQGELDAGGDAETNACARLDARQDAVFFLSADDSNSMASPAIARSMLRQGQRPPAQILRTYEFLNYYDIGYPVAAAGSLAIQLDMRRESTGELELQIGVASEASRRPRRPMNLTFVLDTSGSMSGAPIALERSAVLAIASSLAAGDIVSMVTWNTANAVVLDSHVVSGPNDALLVARANALEAGGGTDLNGGLTKGYEIAEKNFAPSLLNRVILISDGQANVGITEEDIIGRGAALNDGDGIYLTGVGVGAGVNDTLMDTVTDAGRGAYVYLDSAVEATRMFVERFDEVMEVAARGVHVELRLPWYLGIERFFGEEYSTNPRDVEPQHLAPDDAMVFTQLLAPCSPEVVSNDDPVEVIARWQVPVIHTPAQVTAQTTIGELLAANRVYLAKGRAIIDYAEALKGSAESHALLTEANELAAAADPGGTDPELREIRELVGLALTLY